MGTSSDQLRNALSSVLGMQSDNDSIDLDDMTEAEAKRLDQGLSAVFQSMKKPNAKKKTKKERTIATTVMHFRIRVLDLIESYLKSEPSMEICLEIMLALFNMVELCVDSDLKQLSDRIDKVLGKLLSLRNFQNVANVGEQDLCKILNELMDRKVNLAAVDMFNKLLTKSVAFIVCNVHSVEKQNGSVVNAITKYATEFLYTRNPKMNFTLLNDTFKLRWIGVWAVGSSLAEHGLAAKKQNLRSFRRIQLFELLVQLYKNHGFIQQNPKAIDQRNATIVARILNYLDAMQRMNKIHPKEFLALVAVLNEMNKCSRNADVLKLNEKINWKLVGDQVQSSRQKVVLMSLDSYQVFCHFVDIKVIKQCDVKPVQNGHGIDIIENGLPTTDENENVKKKKKKRKLQPAAVDGEEDNAKVNKKQKKFSKEERLRIASEGLNGMSFTSVSLDDVEVESNSDSE